MLLSNIKKCAVKKERGTHRGAINKVDAAHSDAVSLQIDPVQLVGLRRDGGGYRRGGGGGVQDDIEQFNS